MVVGVFSYPPARNHDHESVITKPQHHHAHTEDPTMGLRSLEYENTTNTPRPPLVWA
ncbi:hypothetical protein CDHC01_0693 [Corynebacterium diphtheriae HC01]|nr:hypothetical protein CD241_0693 [Corynebacterium diphtheriae 241]AEX73946.1 hypothetical protein CDHC01_0693 [Corynebacterium diphtheriae HC01]